MSQSLAAVSPMQMPFGSIGSSLCIHESAELAAGASDVNRVSAVGHVCGFGFAGDELIHSTFGAPAHRAARKAAVTAFLQQSPAEPTGACALLPNRSRGRRARVGDVFVFLGLGSDPQSTVVAEVRRRGCAGIPAPRIWPQGVTSFEQTADDIQQQEKDEAERQEEAAGQHNLCPEGRAKCVHDCGNRDPSEANFTTEAGCAVRCLESCTDPQDTTDIDKCPEGKPACAKHCEEIAGGTQHDEQLTACKARCADACCPEGIDKCRANCQNKIPPQQEPCRMLCDTNCQAPNPALPPPPPKQQRRE